MINFMCNVVNVNQRLNSKDVPDVFNYNHIFVNGNLTSPCLIMFRTSSKLDFKSILTLPKPIVVSSACILIVTPRDHN